MKITAMLSWYDEPVALLEDGVRSLAGFCDRLIALDGAYAFTPDAKAASSPEQVLAIHRAAKEAGISAEVHPGIVWAGQIQKRQHLLDLAGAIDWLVVHDADHRLEGDPAAFRSFLDGLEPDVVAVDVSYCTPAVVGKQITPWHEWLTNGAFYTPIVFRCLSEMKLERHHWWYSGLLDGERVALQGWDNSGGDWEEGNTLPQGRHAQTDTLSVTHRCFDKPEATLKRQRVLYAARAELVAANGIEP